VTGRPREGGPWPMLTLGGAGLLALGVAGLFALPRTRIETGADTGRDARLPGPKLTPNGVAF
jgi:hypothetical protein